MQKITTHLWYDKEAKVAADFYTSVFNNSRVKSSSVLNNTPSGSVDIVNVELCGQEFTLISAGPLFKFNPSISFQVACKTKNEVDAVWEQLAEKGTVLMELGSYPFSERFGWVADRYGLSWQISAMGDAVTQQKITPFLMFTGGVVGKAGDAMNFYTSVFHDAAILQVQQYGTHEPPDQEGTVKYATFTLEHKEFCAMDSAYEHKFAFNEAISFMVHCNTQQEIDYYWEKLSAVPQAEQCGWLKDKYGVSWQIVPNNMDKMLSGDPKKVARVTEAFLKMKKFDLAALERVAQQSS